MPSTAHCAPYAVHIILIIVLFILKEKKFGHRKGNKNKKGCAMRLNEESIIKNCTGGKSTLRKKKKIKKKEKKKMSIQLRVTDLFIEGIGQERIRP